MTKITSLILILTLLFSIFSLTSCAIMEAIDASVSFKDDENGKNPSEKEDIPEQTPTNPEEKEEEKKEETPPPPTNSTPENEEDNNEEGDNGEKNEGESEKLPITVPDIPTPDNKLVFSEIEYFRPDCEAYIKILSDAAELIRIDEADFETQLGVLIDLESNYADFLTMYSYAELMTQMDTKNEYWAAEFLYLSESYPAFSEAIENMFVAAANSKDAKRYEDEYFGPGLIEQYKDGGIYSDELVALQKKEAELEAKYLALSTKNVIISYQGRNASYDDIMSFYAENYGKDSFAYKSAEAECTQLYEAAKKEESTKILIDLIKLRRKMSSSMGYESYAEFAYAELGHEYTPEDLLSLVTDIRNYIIPVYYYLESFIFYDFFQNNHVCPSIEKDELISKMEELLLITDENLFSVYRYMIESELYSIEPSSENRFNGAFTTYIENYSAPFVFVSLHGDITDYMTLSHEFGHFVDSFVNMGYYSSLDLTEVYSTALEWLMLESLSDKLCREDCKYLRYYRIRSSLETLVYQTLYALFEHYAYEIPENQINEGTLLVALKNAAKELGLSRGAITSLDPILIPHIITVPFYVQSYTVSEATALGIYLMECESENAGLAAYKKLIVRESSSLTFEEYLELAKIPSPFEEKRIKLLANEIYYLVVGSHLFNDE